MEASVTPVYDKLLAWGEEYKYRHGGGEDVLTLIRPNGDAEVSVPMDWQRDIDRWLWEEAVRAHGEVGAYVIAGGAAGAWTLTNNTRTYFLNGTFVIGTDSFKIALFTSTSNIGATSTTYAGVTNEVAAASGYSTGGIATTLSLSGTTSVPIAFTQCQWTSSGTITARFGVMYEVAGNVMAYFLLDSTPADVSVSSGNTLTISAGNVITAA